MRRYLVLALALLFVLITGETFLYVKTSGCEAKAVERFGAPLKNIETMWMPRSGCYVRVTTAWQRMDKYDVDGQ